MSDRDIQPDVQTAALAVACRVLDQAVHAAILPALRAPCCCCCCCCCRRTADIEHLRAQRQ